MQQGYSSFEEGVISSIEELQQSEGPSVEYSAGSGINISSGIISIQTDGNNGYATNSLYGLTKLSDNYTSIDIGNGIVASQKALYNVYNNIPNSIQLAEGNLSLKANENTLASVRINNVGIGTCFRGSVSLGQGEFIEGKKNVMQWDGLNCHIEGTNNTAEGQYCHLEGENNIALYGTWSAHVEGYYNAVAGSYGHAEGRYTMANHYAHSEGEGNARLGRWTNNNSSSIGALTISNNQITRLSLPSTLISNINDGYFGCITDEGIVLMKKIGSNYDYLSSGSVRAGEREIYYVMSDSDGYSEPFGNLAYGRSSHSEGYHTLSIGLSSHAEGTSTTSFGDSSHTSGIGTCSGLNTTGQFICGKWNSNKTDSLFEIGNGTSTSRKNAFRVDQNGNLYITGQIYTAQSGT